MELKEVAGTIKIKLNNKEYELNKLSLEVLCEIEQLLDMPYIEVFTKIQKCPANIITAIIYSLIKDKKDFVNYKDFKSKLSLGDLVVLTEKYNEIFKVSFPEDNSKVEKKTT